MRTARFSALNKPASPLFIATIAGSLALFNVSNALAQAAPGQEVQPPTKAGPKPAEPEKPAAPDAQDQPTSKAADQSEEEEAEVAPDTQEPAAATGQSSTSEESAQAASNEIDGANAAAPSDKVEATAPAASPDSTPNAPAAEPGGLASMESGADAGLGFGEYPNPASDQEELKEQGEERPTDIEPDRVFAEEWWAHTRPTIELHGNFRVRANLYHNFHFNRLDAPESALWPRPLDAHYDDLNGNKQGAEACTPDEADTGSSDTPSRENMVGCKSPTQGGADIRFRVEPSIIISDNLRVRSQIDLLGNLVMGSTAQGNMNYPAATGGGYAVSGRSGYSPISGMSSSQDSPVSGINSLQDAISVRRAWAEYDTPVGQLKFGRMPDHWGLGVLYNAGDNLDGDYQSTADRIAFTTGLPSWSTYIGGSWDYQDEGATSAGFTPPGGPAYDLSQRDDVSRMNLQLYRRMDPQLERNALAKGKVVVNGGLYLSYRWQRIANDVTGPSATCSGGADALGCKPGEAASGLVRRGMKIWTPDVYVELKYQKFFFGFEAVTHQGKFDSLATAAGDNDYTDPNGNKDGWRVNQWGFAGELKQKLVEDRLLLGFSFGYGSGDGDVDTLIPPAGVQEQHGDRSIETFRFHPGYRVDLILNRHILSRVQGSYYFKPMAQYDFIRKSSGLKLGGRAEAIWTRASNFMQTPGHQRDLGIELDASVYYQSKDGSLNSRDDLTGGFFTQLQYGVAFPLSGLSYLQDDREGRSAAELKLKPAQMVRWFVGVAF